MRIQKSIHASQATRLIVFTEVGFDSQDKSVDAVEVERLLRILRSVGSQESFSIVASDLQFL